MNKKNKIREADEESYPPRSRQGVDSGIRWCGCPTPKDYPKIDIHNSKCRRRSRLEGPTVGNKGVPKVYPSGRKVRRGDGPPRLTPIHQNSKQWFFGHDYGNFVDPKGNVWLAMAKRFDNKYHKP